ncbi:MAG TPA: hypothetical protein VJX74_06650, partial [Blastocatellia bacterium]|nr:hypothetical protein [Blastocatellia bacterium]
KVCNEIKWRIDEADHPDQLNLEINRHTSHCAECRTYAEERAQLRSLLVGGARVSVPVNFDAVLNARLAEVKAQKSFAWFSPAVYLQFGTATAVLAVMFFAAQYSNLFSNNYQAAQAGNSSEIKTTFQNSPLATIPPTPHMDYGFNNVAPRPYQPVRYNSARTNRLASRTPDGYVSLNDGGVILVRGQNGEREVPVQTVSIGAQPLLYSSRQPQIARSVSTF